MGALFARITGRPRLQFARLKTVLRNVCEKDEAVGSILKLDKHASGDDEKDFILMQIAEQMYNFVQMIMQDEILHNISELRCACYCLGKQHAAYTVQSFKVVYWDEFTLAMIEELENTNRLSNEDLRAWQTLVHLIVENMLRGYDHAKKTQIER
ncbi:unnamed protein product [Anisakis simplex]|uniref:GLOBIN domain-containing protein n=1 Tax=Anisakis simplex TaxID=6269 RepID=A0A0M3JUE0_ANISI|nr:unnamed protein product [Anisakis simplex]